MANHMMSIVADNAKLHALGKTISGAELKRLVTQNNSIVQTIDRLSRRYNREILEALVSIGPIVEQELGDRESVTRIATTLETVLNASDSDTVLYTVSGNSTISTLTVSIQQYGLEETIDLPASLFK